MRPQWKEFAAIIGFWFQIPDDNTITCVEMSDIFRKQYLMMIVFINCLLQRKGEIWMSIIIENIRTCP